MAAYKMDSPEYRAYRAAEDHEIGLVSKEQWLEYELALLTTVGWLLVLTYSSHDDVMHGASEKEFHLHVVSNHPKVTHFYTVGEDGKTVIVKSRDPATPKEYEVIMDGELVYVNFRGSCGVFSDKAKAVEAAEQEGYVFYGSERSITRALRAQEVVEAELASLQPKLEAAKRDRREKFLIVYPDRADWFTDEPS